MKALRSFAVRASLPEPLGVLMKIAQNLRWSWDARSIDLFRWVDSDAWERAEHDPVKMLGFVSRQRFQELSDDGPFMSFLASIDEDLSAYLEEPRWFQAHQRAGKSFTVAYFSPEFGVSEALPIYSGGLGVLSGDHLKAASDLGLPLIGVGLLYRQGYFRQHLNADGWQQERYPSLDPHAMPLSLVLDGNGDPVQIEVDLAGNRCAAQVWSAQIGRVDLLLMDTDVEDNAEEERLVTDRLYAGGSEHRLRQEILLGIGGVRALRAAGFDAEVFHTNEGHAGFMGLERIRELVERGLQFDEAREAVRAATVFTTHTPVPAGIDVYDRDLMKRYFDDFARQCNISLEDLMKLGNTAYVPDDPEAENFNMAIMGLRLAEGANGVSKLHGDVSRTIFSSLWPNVPQDEVPIGSITNGVHTSTWLGPEIAEILDRRLAPGWAETGEGRWEKVRSVPDAELWRSLERARERLVFFVRNRVRRQLIARGATESELGWTDEVFDPGILTIGFARRFAMYKRGTLLLRDVDRLKRLLASQDRPIQVVIAGKAHPLDDGGKEMIRQLVHFAADPDVRLRFAFIEDYDMEVARVLSQGSDIWLNNPRRPLEACGTSGMKAAINGTLNCSILDGWWDEMFDGDNGWAIGTRDTYLDHDYQDAVESSALYDLLERDIAPRFYDRSEGQIPRRWIERVKESMATLGPSITADRMVRDYVETYYVPAAERGRQMADDDFARARALAAWKQRLYEAWDGIEIIDVEGDVRAAEVEEKRSVSATVRVGHLDPDDISVQLAHGLVGANNELVNPTVDGMKADVCSDGTCTYRGEFSCEGAGLYGFAVRVVPQHVDLANQMNMGLVTWA